MGRPRVSTWRPTERQPGPGRAWVCRDGELVPEELPTRTAPARWRDLDAAGRREYRRARREAAHKTRRTSDG